MSHRGSKIWKENLSKGQVKFLIKKHGGFWQNSMDGFDSNQLDKLKNQYEHDREFNSLGQEQGQGPNISDFKFDKLV